MFEWKGRLMISRGAIYRGLCKTLSYVNKWWSLKAKTCQSDYS